MMKIILLQVFILINSSQMLAQNEEFQKPFLRCLTLQMTGKKHNLHFHEGDEITLKLFSRRQKHTIEIVELSDSSLFYFPNENQHSIFDLQEVKFRDIKKIYFGGKKQVFGTKGVGALGGAGLLLFSFDNLNRIGKPAVGANPTIFLVSTGLIGLSYVINSFQNPAYRISKKHSLRLYHIQNPQLHFKNTF